MARNWTRFEVEATVADYLEMLWLELREEPPVKAEHRRNLQRLLNDRTEGAIERKHQNISAILLELGLPYISGYKPLRNYQALLFDTIEAQVAQSHFLRDLIAEKVDEPAEVPRLADWQSMLVEPPKGWLPASGNAFRERPPTRRIDYLARETRNASLGLAGETLVLEFERARLRGLGQKRLAEKIEHVSQTRGDAEGFDILSFDPGGAEKVIEVKTTAFAKATPFYVTRNELSVSEDRAEEYSLYRVFNFRRRPRLFELTGALRSTCVLHATQYVARVA